MMQNEAQIEFTIRNDNNNDTHAELSKAKTKTDINQYKQEGLVKIKKKEEEELKSAKHTRTAIPLFGEAFTT